eukprot:6665062-Pyramimonas_sp.AAC.2
MGLDADIRRPQRVVGRTESSNYSPPIFHGRRMSVSHVPSGRLGRERERQVERTRQREDGKGTESTAPLARESVHLRVAAPLEQQLVRAAREQRRPC